MLLDSEPAFEIVLDLFIRYLSKVETAVSADLSMEVTSFIIPLDFFSDLAFWSKVFHLYAYIKPSPDPDLEKSELEVSSLVVADFNKFERGELTETALDLSEGPSSSNNIHPGSLVSSFVHLIVFELLIKVIIFD